MRLSGVVIALVVLVLFATPASSQWQRPPSPFTNSPHALMRTATIPALGPVKVEMGFARGVDENAEPYGTFEPRSLTYPFVLYAIVELQNINDDPVTITANYAHTGPDGQSSDAPRTRRLNPGTASYRYSRGPFRPGELAQFGGYGGHKFELFLNGVLIGRLFVDVVQ